MLLVRDVKYLNTTQMLLRIVKQKTVNYFSGKCKLRKIIVIKKLKKSPSVYKDVNISKEKCLINVSS